jgi:hypothetical protein
MSDIFREVDEEVRRDQAVAFWEKYQNYIIAAGLAVVAATAAYQAYQTYRTRAAEAAGAKFETALQLARDGKPAEAKAAFSALAADAPDGYRGLARFAVADQTGLTDPAAAIQAFDALAEDAATPPLMQDVARLRAAALRLDTADLAETKKRLEPLLQVGRPFRNSARELLGYAAVRAKDYDLAGDMFEGLVSDPGATAAQRQRAEAMLSVVQSGKAPPVPH